MQRDMQNNLHCLLRLFCFEISLLLKTQNATYDNILFIGLGFWTYVEMTHQQAMVSIFFFLIYIHINIPKRCLWQQHRPLSRRWLGTSRHEVP